MLWGISWQKDHLLNGIHKLIGESVNVLSKDKVQKTFATTIKSITLPKSLGGSFIDKNNIKESVTMTEICEKINASTSESGMSNTSLFNLHISIFHRRWQEKGKN